MKRFKKQLVPVIVVLTLTTVNYAAVYEFHDDFDNGPDPDEWVMEGESHPPYPPGRYPLDATSSGIGLSSLTRSIGGTGDYTCEVQLLNFDTIGWSNKQYLWLFDDAHFIGGGRIQMHSPDNMDGLVLDLMMHGPDFGIVFHRDIGATSSLGLRVSWEDDPAPGATGTYSAWYNQNNTGWMSMGSFINGVDATPGRTHTFYSGDSGSAKGYMEIDSYDIVPEPASMTLMALGSVCILKRRKA